MPNKEIQEQRTRGYFIQAAKENLKGEGLRSVNVRAIAERAGYSYATMYRYFTNVQDLVFECVKDFADECEVLVREETKVVPSGIEKIKAIARSYMKYFVQYPGIFDLFFLEKVENLANKQSTVALIHDLLDRLCEEEWARAVAKKTVSRDKVPLLKDRMRYTVTGLLLFYLNRRQPDTYDAFLLQVDDQLHAILDVAKTSFRKEGKMTGGTSRRKKP